MDCRYLVFTFVFVGLTVAPPPGPRSEPLPGIGGQGGGGGLPSSQGSSQGGFQVDSSSTGPGGPGGSLNFGPSSNGIGAPSGSFTEQPNQQQQQQQQQQQYMQFGLSAEGQKQGAQTQPSKIQGQGFYQFRPQDGSSNSQMSQATNYQQYQAFQQGQIPSSSGYSQQNPWDQQLGSYTGGLPSYGYSSNSPFSGYMSQHSMGYLPSVYNHVPMVIAAPHDFTPFSASYGGLPMGVGGYGMQQMYGSQTYPQATAFGSQTYPQATAFGSQTYPQATAFGSQAYPQATAFGSQGYGVIPVGTNQNQMQFSQGQVPGSDQNQMQFSQVQVPGSDQNQMQFSQVQVPGSDQNQMQFSQGQVPNSQGNPTYTSSSLQIHTSNQKPTQPQAQTNGKIQTSP